MSEKGKGILAVLGIPKKGEDPPPDDEAAEGEEGDPGVEAACDEAAKAIVSGDEARICEALKTLLDVGR